MERKEMKKTLFLTMLVAVAVLGGCKKNEDKKSSDADGFKFRESTVTIAVGSTTRLALVDDKKANDYVWSTSDTLVATVNTSGEVTGTGAGEAVITVVSGERKAQCQVVVKEYMETLNFPLAIVWDIDVEPLADRPDTTLVRESGTYNCVWGVAEIILVSEGLYWDNDGSLTGADEGVLMTVYATALYDSVQRVQFVLGDYEIVPKADPDADYADELHIAPGGYYEEAYKYYSEVAAKDYIAYYEYKDTTVAEEMVTAWKYMAACPYASMDYLYYVQGETEEESGYSGYYWPSGFAKAGEFSLDSHESLQYMCAVTYANISAAYFDDYSFFGWAVKNEEWPASVDDVELEWLGPVDVVYSHGTKSTEGVKELRAPIIKRDYPQIAAKMEKAMSAKTLHRK